MNIDYESYEDFKQDYLTYQFDKCDDCSGIREIIETDLLCKIGNRTLHFPSMMVLKCKNCGKECLPQHTKRMIDGAYKAAVKEGQLNGEFVSKGYRKRFKYCQEQEYIYDHRDYYNIPGLSYDEEHSEEGFLTPVYFDRNVLIYFITMPEFEVDIFSETYGHIAKKDAAGAYPYDWAIPFGFNSEGKLVMWLGDMDVMDGQSKAIFKSFNVESDHLLIDSEFYQAQMNCIFSEPIVEKQILINKAVFIKNVSKKYSIDLSHLTDECAIHENDVKRPIVFTEQSVSGVINAYDKVLVEGFNVLQMRLLYEKLYPEIERNKKYKEWQSIKLIEAILLKWCSGMQEVDIFNLMSPLYILHDYRIYFDHLLSGDKREEIKAHIASTLDVTDFSQQEAIYNEEVSRLNKLFQHLVLLSK